MSINDYTWTAPGKTTLPGGSVSTRTYDGLLQPQSLRLKTPGQQQILSLDNQWDNRQQLHSAARSDSSPAGSLQHNNQYSYDAALRLTTVETDTGGLFSSTQTYTLDALANRTQDSTTGNWLYDANNRLLQRGSGSEQVSYQYDANGNLLQQTSAAGTTRYIYDTNNRLQAIYSGAQQLIARYSYDPLNRRISKEQYRTADGTPLPQPLRTYYLYSDEGLLAESQQFIQPNADGSVTALNTPAISSQYGPVPDAPFSTGILFIKTRDHNGNHLVAYYQHNHLQAPLQAIDKQGNIRWAAQYTAFGQSSIISSGDSAINSNLRLPGQYADGESGLYYNWQRYYDANTGRYISSDPIGLTGGFNRYAYVGGNPVGWADPSGLYQCVYSIYRHTMNCYAQENGHGNFGSSNVVSGNNKDGCDSCQNNPYKTEKKYEFHGPIPEGVYEIGQQKTNDKGVLTSRRPLTPVGHNANGRSDFQIHGCSDPTSCSAGCIALTTNADRDKFNKLLNTESQNTLTVIY